MRFGFGIFKKIALSFALLPFDAEPIPRTKQQLPPFFLMYRCIVSHSNKPNKEYTPCIP